MTARRVLVTGGAGFIGSHVADLLAGAGRSVVALDDLSAGRREHLAGAAASGRCELVVGSACDDALVRSLAARCDAVVHLAAAVGVRKAVERPVATIEGNLRATSAVLAAAAERNLPVVVASSSEVYGRGARAPFREDDDLVLGAPSSVRWGYAAGKLCDEHLALAWHRERGLPARVVRIFNTAGPRQSGEWGMVIPRFVRRALDGAPLEVHGDGSQTRSFCHVADTAEAIVRLLDAPAAPDAPAAAGRVFNVGSPRETTVLSLAESVLRAAGSRSRIVFVPHEAVYGAGFEDLRRRVPDVSRLAETAGFAALRTLDDILRDTVAWMRASTGGGVA
ncbi:MAG: dTDP-glucose 4,6-dehydratase [Planctomycetes bacterium]|nr:dTDP-glucose 4,6-dehydratase [Planctomycetota bacterium]